MSCRVQIRTAALDVSQATSSSMIDSVSHLNESLGFGRLVDSESLNHAVLVIEASQSSCCFTSELSRCEGFCCRTRGCRLLWLEQTSF
jgi:hypothetical protein